jgi:hypothetical protein
VEDRIARSSAIPYATASAALERAYGRISDLAADLSAHQLLSATRCHGWVVADVLFHVLADAQRALAAFASPADGPADRDFVTYWTGFAAEPAGASGSVEGIWSVKRSAAAFHNGLGGALIWRDTAPAAVRAARLASSDGFIETQGHVLAVPDFIATLVTEAVIHHYDMVVNLPDAPVPDDTAVAVATQTLDGLLALKSTDPSAVWPMGWTAREYVLRATGREAAADPLADLFPLLS